MSSNVSARVKKRRDSLRAAGLRPVQIWVSDTRRPGFLEECRRQSAVVAKADADDAGLHGFMEEAMADLDPAEE